MRFASAVATRASASATSASLPDGASASSAASRSSSDIDANSCRNLSSQSRSSASTALLRQHAVALSLRVLQERAETVARHLHQVAERPDQVIAGRTVSQSIL